MSRLIPVQDNLEALGMWDGHKKTPHLSATKISTIYITGLVLVPNWKGFAANDP